jgi:hypothetical protein
VFEPGGQRAPAGAGFEIGMGQGRKGFVP